MLTGPPPQQIEVECPACHRSFAASGAPPFVCLHCRTGGIPARVFYPVKVRL